MKKLIVLFFILIPVLLFAQLNTGFKSPTAEGLIYSDFNNPTNAYSSDNLRSYIYVAYPNTKYQDWYNYSFGIPSTAIISGIEVTLEYYNLYTPTQYIFVYSTSASTYGIKTIAYRTSEAVITFGGSKDLWGTTWTASDFDNRSFFCMVSAASLVSGTKRLYIDHVQVKVYYSIPNWGHILNTIAGINILKVNTIAISNINSINRVAK